MATLRDLRFSMGMMVGVLLAGSVACGGSSSAPAARPSQGPPAYGPPGYGPPGSAPPGYGRPAYGPPGYGPPGSAPPGYGPPANGPPANGPPANGPPVSAGALLPGLLGSPAWRAETANILRELIATLPAAPRGRVQGIPLAFENNPADVNAFAGCDEQGRPFMAATEGILVAVDAVSNCRATDELFGTRTYEQYASQVAPQMVRSETFVPSLPAGLIPPAYVADPRRLSRAREIFQEMIAFTFAHELAHHYLDHTGCAKGQPMGVPPDALAVGRIASNVVPGFNQINEYAADNAGVLNVLDAGRARAPSYRWTEQGGLLLLDFFGRLSTAAGMSPFHPLGILKSHPNPLFRRGWVTTFATGWYATHK